MPLRSNEIRIATPCDVDWSSMTRRDANKRFCASCKKHVHDLSSMGEDDAKALLASRATEGLCVRYLADERGNVAFKPDVPSARLERASVLALAVAAPLGLTACMGAYMPPPEVPAASASAAPSASAVPSSAVPSSAVPAASVAPSASAPPSSGLPTPAAASPASPKGLR